MGSILAVLATMVSNKKLLGVWLVTLSSAVGTVGHKVYIDRTTEIGDIRGDMKSVLSDLEEIKGQLKANSQKLDHIIVEQTKVATEFSAHEKAQAQKEALDAAREIARLKGGKSASK